MLGINQSFPTSFIIYFYYFLGSAFVLSTVFLGMYVYGYKFPNKLTVKNRRPKKYMIYSIYSNFAGLMIETFALLYSILNINQLLYTPMQIYSLYPVLAIDTVILSPNIILELIYHLHWKQDFLNSH